MAKKKMKKLLMKLFKVPDVNIALVKERKIIDAKITKLKMQIRENRKEIEYLQSDVILLYESLSDIGRFLYDRKELEKQFIHKGHDPIGKRCDVCKGREFGILDYRDKLFAIIHERDGLLGVKNTQLLNIEIVNEN